MFYLEVLHIYVFLISSCIPLCVLEKSSIQIFLNRVCTSSLFKDFFPFLMQLHHFLKKVSFNNSAGDQISFDQNGELIAGFDVINQVTFPNQTVVKVKVGRLDPQAPPSEAISINEDAIVWHSWFNQVEQRFTHHRLGPITASSSSYWWVLQLKCLIADKENVLRPMETKQSSRHTFTGVLVNILITKHNKNLPVVGAGLLRLPRSAFKHICSYAKSG